MSCIVFDEITNDKLWYLISNRFFLEKQTCFWSGPEEFPAWRIGESDAGVFDDTRTTAASEWFNKRHMCVNRGGASSHGYGQWHLDSLRPMKDLFVDFFLFFVSFASLVALILRINIIII